MSVLQTDGALNLFALSLEQIGPFGRVKCGWVLCVRVGASSC